MCNTNVITKSLTYCYKCVCQNIQEIKKIEHNIVREYGLVECQNCDKKYINKKTEYYLCKICIKTDKIIKCNTLTCQTFMVVNINSYNIVYCDDCEKKIIKCVDCNNKFISHNNIKKCDSCVFNEKNNCINIVCVRCNNSFTSKITWKKKRYCNDCYKKINDIIDEEPICKCGLIMVKKNVKKDGPNKGRIALSCAKYPIGCNKFMML